MNSREFEAWFRKLYVPLGMYALRIIGSVDESRDIVQETFARVWEALEAGAVIADFKAYMYRAVRNETLARMRRRQIAVDLSEVGHVTEQQIDTSERDARLWLAIDRLPQRCREIFLMSKRDGMTNAEIADELSISIKTVENQMTKALKTLRTALTPATHKPFFLPFL